MTPVVRRAIDNNLPLATLRVAIPFCFEVIFMNFKLNLDTPLDFFAFFLAISVVFVNGFTDAPNSIHSSVKAGALSLWRALLTSGIFNFLGVGVSAFISFSVGKSVWALADTKSGENGTVIVCACLITVILVGILAWLFKMPSSESHALLFSLMGANFGARQGASLGIGKIIFISFCMIISTLVAYVFSRLLFALSAKRLKVRSGWLVLSCCALSFMHGVQDGQKLLAIILILLGVNLSATCAPPAFIVLTVAAVMGISTIFSGKRILSSIDKLSESTDASGIFCADLAAFSTLIICSFLGMPVSTGNVKSASVFATDRVASGQSKRVIMRIFLTSLITLPISFFFGFIICKLLLIIL